MMTKDNKNGGWIIGAMTLIGMGVGFVFLKTSPLIFVACMFIGIGLGLLIAALLAHKKK